MKGLVFELQRFVAYGTSDNDAITISSLSRNSVYAYGGNDSIYSYRSDYAYIDAGAGNDMVSVQSNASWGWKTTIRGGAGNDTIYGNSRTNKSSRGDVYIYEQGDDNDLIYGYTSYDTISIGGSSYYTRETVGTNVIVNVIGSGAITLSGASGKAINIKGGTPTVSGGKYISSFNSNTVITGTAYDDTIFSSKSSVTIDGGAGADIISLSSSDGLTVVKGGAGNDTIYGDTAEQIYQYENGDGYDVIYGYSENDTITITGGDWSKSTVDNDVIISVTNTGSTVQTGAITLSGAKGKKININGEDTDAAQEISAQQEVIQKFMGVLDTVTSEGLGRLNQAVSVASGGYFTNIISAINQMVSDCKNASSANNFLLNYCGIDLSNTDTGAITGADAGGSEIKTASSVIPENDSLHNFTDNTFTTSNGLTVYLAYLDMTDSGVLRGVDDMSFDSLENDTQKYIWQAFETWWADNSFDLIAQSYGENYSFGSNSSATVSEMTFGFFNVNSNTLAATWRWYSTASPAETVGITMGINMKYYDSITAGDVDGVIPGSTQYLDRVLSHELTHAVMMANVDYFNDLPQFITEGTAELTHGIDDNRNSVIKYLAANSSALKNSLSLLPGTGNSYSYAGGYMFLRYLAKQVADNASASSLSASVSELVSNSDNSTNSGATIKGNVLTVADTFEEDVIDLAAYPSTVTKVNATALTSNVVIVGNTSANSIKAGSGADTVSGNAGNDTILGGDGNDLLMGDSGNDNIKGDAGNDTILGGYGNDTISGGAGNDTVSLGGGADVYIYSSGNDLIQDYAAGTDKIKLSGTSITSASVSGSNIVLKTSTGNITVKNGKDKQITIIDASGKETSKVYPISIPPAGISVSGALLTASNDFTGSEIDLADYATTVTKVNAAALTSGISILGTEANNSIKGSKGDDTISGGAGNDTVSLGGGADVYIYSGGNDLIQNYTTGEDKIKLSGTSITGASVSGSNVILQTSSGNITVRGVKNKQLTIIDADGKETSQVYPTYMSYDANKTAVTLITGFTGTLKADAYDSTVEKIDASVLSKIFINGNANDNTIHGAKGADTIYGAEGNDSIFGAAGADKLFGDAGNDTLWGGTGNDTLTGGDGSDTFIFGSGEGRDIIADYEAGDKIKISSGTISKTAYSGQNVIFTVGSVTLTVKNAKGKAITITDASDCTTTQIYTTGVSYSSSGRNSNALWFTEDDTNFISSSANLDEISTEKFSVTNVETPANFEFLAQESSTLIISSNK